MSVGLKRGTVKVIPYQKKWAKEFEKEKARILKVCGDKIIAIEHIGSTSVPGLAAKPIIDIAVGVAKLKDAEKLLQPLKKIGYNFYKKFQRQRLFIAKGPDERRTHYLHVMRYNGSKWKTDQLFRNYLRTHSAEVKRYADLKKSLAKEYADDRKSYSDHKNKFIQSIITKAQKY
ncbi:MAG: GrpB family protein [Parcubacteria group bacterium]|nr:GrpB family protein [Parcubacteria group bacterium]